MRFFGRQMSYAFSSTGLSSGTGRGFGFVALGALAAAAGCAPDFDASRAPAPRGTLGEELFGVICDRVGAQALHEDLTGASFNGVCHKSPGGTYADVVDTSRLPAADPAAVDVSGNAVSIDQQNTNRNHAVSRVQALARRRADLIAAFDATFPDIKIPIKDITSSDPASSCKAPAANGEAKLATELADMLGRIQSLYNDGTIPQSTESFARVMNAFKASTDAQAAYVHFDARQGYRPVEVALGAGRPVLAYPGFREFANGTLSLLSSDSNPYDPSASRDQDGRRIPVPGAAYSTFSKMLGVTHEELRNATGDGVIPPLLPPTVDPVGRVLYGRARTNLEFTEELFSAQDPAFGGGNSHFIVKRDMRGYASVALDANGAVPAPFVDKNGDGMADVDPLGRFITTDGKPPPSPFFAVGAAEAPARDPFGRALSGQVGQLVYDYIDTSHTYAASLLLDLKALVNPDPAQKHETLMNALAGAYVLSGTRDGTEASQRTYAPDPSAVDTWKLTHADAPPADLATRPVVVNYDAFHAEDAPMLDLVYAIGQVLGDPTTDDTLAYTRELFANHPADLARQIGNGLAVKAIADKHPEAHIPARSVFWDEMIDIGVQIAQEPGLLEDLLRSLGADESLPLGTIYSNYSKYNDQITYDRNNLNGPAWNATTNSAAEMQTPVDRSSPTAADTGWNRSAFQRFIELVHDTHNVTMCNKEGAVLHAQGVPIAGSIDMPLFGGTYKECEVFKIENGAKFYLDAITGRANLYFRPSLLRNGVFGIGAATVDMVQQSSGIDGFWDGLGSQTFRPKPQWLNRLMFFDLANDSKTPGPNSPNYTTNNFLKDLQGPNMGTAACPERVITDPDPGAADASSDGKVHGLRACADGDWLYQRDNNTIFTWENFGFYRAMTPMLTAFANHNKEDLFIELMEVLHRHFADDKGTPGECKLGTDGNGNPINCSKDGLVTYEPLLVETYLTDLLPAMHDLVKTLAKVSIPHCAPSDVDPASHLCKVPQKVDGVTVIAEAVRSLIMPDRASLAGLKDRKGAATGLRNDGSTNPQVTPLYLITHALDNMDAAFAFYATKHPDDKDRLAVWRSARSQLVDQFLGVNGATTTAAFANASFPKITPVLLDTLRAQILAHCPDPNQRCAWARDDLTKKMQDTMRGPTYAATMDLVDAIRKDEAGRTQAEALLQYLLDSASQNDALAALLASSNDMIQLLQDDANLVPLYHVMSEALAPSVVDPQGHIVRKGMVDAQTSFITRITGKAFDANHAELCSSELDPNQVLTMSLQHLVTPMTTADGKVGQTPLEVIMDVIADVNRAAPEQTDKLAAGDYASIADNVSDFLLNKERGLEQFYEIVRQGTQ